MTDDSRPGSAGQNEGQRLRQTELRPGTAARTWTEEEEEALANEPTVTNRDPVVGTHVSGYLVKGRLGVGGMGIVYEGQQPVIGKRVAIKVLRPEIADDPDVVQRLVSEARAVNSVGHRGIVDVFGFGELPDGRQCIVMEFLDGASLESVLDAHRLHHRVMPIEDAMIILDEVLSALAAAHAAGVVHRDLKPSNVFLCRQKDGTQYVKLLDFGIAKLGVLASPTPQTRASLMLGTPSYMAPEQARGEAVGPAMDLYAVGVMTFELLTGRTPFVADSVVQMLMLHQNEPAPLPSSLVMSIPDDIDELVARLLQKNPQDRYPSADAARADVIRIKKELLDPTARRPQLAARPIVATVGQAMVEPQPVGPRAASELQTTAVTPKRTSQPASEPPAAAPVDVEATPRPTRSWRGPVALLGLLLALVAGGGWYFSSQDAPPPGPVAPPPAAPVAQPSVVPEPVAAPLPLMEEHLAPPVAEVTAPVVAPRLPAPPVPAPAPAVVNATPRPAPPRASRGTVAQALLSRVGKLEARLSAAAATGASVELYQKQVIRIRARLSAADLAERDRDSLEAAISRLEESADY